MPSIMIEVRKHYTPDTELEIMEAVHKAFRDAFKILPHDRNIRFVEHEPQSFQCPPDREKPEFYTLITIDAFVGRSLDAKRNLYQNIVNNLAPIGIPKDHVKIILRELSAENFGVRGGQAAYDIDLGFNINV
ncbi:tautomerase family protein [Acinetobacter sp. CFCC 10889]|uniref:tautomerase family protein n=1 Tax=Acinetobacter sp. CFCC 10889 TaxID=1775557 RepID=UPI000DD09C2F|nr:tautomerase family protein [Acinetobacter sp. CFCC 10889]